jgi:predicted Zn-dependent peptidase
LIDELLLQGADSRLHQEIVQKRGLTDAVYGGMNLLGNMFNYNGPMLYTIALIHDANRKQEEILAAIDAQIARLAAEPVSEAELNRARTKIRSSLYDLVGSSSRFGMVDLLACFALFDNDPSRINQIEARFAEVTPALVQKTARDYLQNKQRTVLTVLPTAAAAKPGAAQ